MPTAEKTQAYTETWRDWMHPDAPEPEPDELFTRDEILQHVERTARLQRLGRAVPGPEPTTVSDVRYWESIGVLPRPTRRRHGRAQYAVYPEWYGHLIRHIRFLQEGGASLDDIRPSVRSWARTLTRPEPPPDTGDLNEYLSLRPALTTELERFGQWHAAVSRSTSPPKSIAVHIEDADGNTTIYTWPYRKAETSEETDS